MKAITLTQPWATLVAIGAKKIETRSWATSYSGPLAIHAAKGLGPIGGKRGLRNLCESEPFCSVLLAHGIDWMNLPLGAVVATCNLVDFVRFQRDSRWFTVQRASGVLGSWQLTDQERAFGDYTPGRLGWLLADIRRLSDPIPARGALGLWEWQT